MSELNRMKSKRISPLLVVTLSTGFVLPSPTMAATPSICAQATAAENAVVVSSQNPAKMVSSAGHASKLDSDCAVAYAKQNQIDLSLVTMAGSFHFGNVVAMGMHLEGDDSDAARLLRQIQRQESQYVSIAQARGSANSQQILLTISNETDALASRSWGGS